MLKATPNNPVLSAALAYAARGWPVFPCKPTNKHPMTKHGHLDASTDPVLITQWFTPQPTQPMPLIGIPMGARSGLMCADLDRHDPEIADGVATWQQWCQDHNDRTVTRSHRTPTNNGAHKIYKWLPDYRSIPSGDLGPGIELKAEGGFAILPPGQMLDENAGEYVLVEDAPVAPVPAWFQAKCDAYFSARTERRQRGRRSAPAPVAPAAQSTLVDDSRASKQEIPCWTDGDLWELRLALRCIDVGKNTYDTWYKVAAALRNDVGGDLGFEQFCWWSQFGPQYTLAECQDKWRKVVDITDIGIGTIYHFANENNWEVIYPADGVSPGTTDDDNIVVDVQVGIEGAETVKLDPQNANTSSQTNDTGPRTNAKMAGQPTDEHGVPLVPLRWADWVRRVLPDPVFLCGKWLTTTSRTLVVAETGIGKTMWAIGLGAAMATGNGTKVLRGTVLGHCQ